MNYQNRSQYDMLSRVCNFGEAHAQRFPEGSSALASFSTVATEVAKIEELAVAEHVASRSARAARKLDARKQLVDSLVRAANTARVLSKSTPELSDHADPPAMVGDRRLLTFARGFMTAATPYAAAFAAHAIAIEDLGALIDALETAVNQRSRRRDELVQTRARLDESLTRALQAVETLDVTVANTFAADPVTLAAWKRERRLEGRRPRVKAARKRAVTAAKAMPAAPPESVAPAEPAESAAPVTSGVAEDATTEAA